jgi:hypothetical protein
MSNIPADYKTTKQVTPVNDSPLGNNELKDHMNNIKSCINENRSLKEDCKELINSYTAVQANLLKLSNEMSNLRSSFLKLDTLEKTNNTLQEKVDQQRSFIDEQKEMMDKSNRENNKTIGELKKQVLDLHKENTKKNLTNEKEYKLICEAEEKRKNAESVRIKNEQSRNASEKSRSANEKSRKANEEQIRELKKSLQDKISESTQVNSHLQENESNREAAEKIREEQESTRTKNEFERTNVVINSSELLSRKLAEIELKIKDMVEIDRKQTCESYVIDKAEKLNLTKETNFKADTTDVSGIIDEIQLSLPEELNSALALVEQEFEVPETSKPSDTPIVVESTENAISSQSDNEIIVVPMETDRQDKEIRDTVVDVVENGSESELISKNPQSTTEEKRPEEGLTVVNDLISFEQKDKESEKLSKETSKRQKKSTNEKVPSLEEKAIEQEQEQNERILTPDADIALSLPGDTNLDIDAIVGPNVPDVFDEPESLKHNVKKASKNTKKCNDVTLSTQKPRENIEEPLINPESPALQTNNDTFSGPTSETLIGDGLLKDVHPEGSTIKESDEVIVDTDFVNEQLKCGSDKGRPI